MRERVVHPADIGLYAWERQSLLLDEAVRQRALTRHRRPIPFPGTVPATPPAPQAPTWAVCLLFLVLGVGIGVAIPAIVESIR